MHEKSTPRALGVPSIDAASRGVRVYDACPPSVATRHLPPQAGGGAWCPLFLPLGGVSSVRSRMQKAGLRLLGGLKFILRRHSVYTASAPLLLLCRVSGGRKGNRVAVMACFGAAQ